MLRKVVSFLLICFVIIGINSNSYASNQNTCDMNFNAEENYAELFLQSINHTSSVSNPIPLYNMNNQLEAVCFDIDNGGYIIVNYNDLSIPELSFFDDKPFENKNQKYVYNGALEYYCYKDNQIISLSTKKAIDVDNVKTIYTKEKINKNDKINSKSMLGVKTVNPEEYLNNSLRTWTTSGGKCGPIAGAICLMYYDDFINDNYVSSHLENKEVLIPVLDGYMDTDESGNTSSDDVKNGLNDFFDDYNVSNSAISSSFSFNAVKSKININRPVIVGTYNHPTFGNHWIIAHGYFDSIVDGNYIIVNNGWGSNNVWVSVGSKFDYIVYFNH